MGRGSIALLFFGVVWTTLVMLLNIVIGSGILGQVQAQRFHSTQGVMTYAQVDRSRTSDGTTYSPTLEYEYTVNGVTYTGTRYQSQDWGSSSHARASRIVREHSPGTEVTVFYNPNNPEQSLLNREVGGMQYMMLLFMMPFNAVMLGMWWAGGLVTWNRLFRPTAGGFKIKIHPPYVNVNVGRIPLVFAALGGAGVFSFVMIFVVGFSVGWEPSIAVAQLALLGSFGVAALSAAGAWYMNKKPKRWLSINEETGEIYLPIMTGRKNVETLPISEVKSISAMPLQEMEQLVGRKLTTFRSGTHTSRRSSRWSSDGDGKAAGYGVLLHMREQSDADDDPDARLGNPNPHLVPAAQFFFANRAEAFGTWLAERIGVPFETADEETPTIHEDPRAGML